MLKPLALCCSLLLLAAPHARGQTSDDSQPSEVYSFDAPAEIVTPLQDENGSQAGTEAPPLAPESTEEPTPEPEQYQPSFDFVFPDAPQETTLDAPGGRSTVSQESDAERLAGCPKNWGCWELIHSTTGTVLGVRATTTFLHYGKREVGKAGFATTYNTEYFGTYESLSVHMAAFGSFGGGTAGTEGSLGGDLDVGFRGKFTETSGPFLRGGASGMLLGNNAFFFSMVEPLRARGGYQIIDGDDIIEFGATQGFVPTGLYEPAEGFRKISRATELGSYLTMQMPRFRLNLSYARLFAEATAIGSPIDIGKAAYCDYRRALTVCGDVFWVRGDVAAGLRYVKANTLYFGITFGLSP